MSIVRVNFEPDYLGFSRKFDRPLESVEFIQEDKVTNLKDILNLIGLMELRISELERQAEKAKENK